ncbi:MAG: arginase family protein [Actinomycetota bacterium]
MTTFTLLGVPIDSVGRSGGTEHAPQAFRAFTRADDPWRTDGGDIDARIRGDVRDPASGVIAIDDVLDTTRRVADVVADLTSQGAVVFVVGGCCALLPGALAGAQRTFGRVGLAYLDGHLDLYDGETSPTGEAADMPISVILGRGPATWVDAAGEVSRPEDVTLLGPRDLDEALTHGHPHPDEIPGLTFVDADQVRRDGAAVIGQQVADRVGQDPDRLWVHLDVDVLDELVFPATDYLDPNGLDLTQLTDLLTPLLRAPALVGFSVGCYNPDKDPDGACGRALADVLRTAIGDAGALP